MYCFVQASDTVVMNKAQFIVRIPALQESYLPTHASFVTPTNTRVRSDSRSSHALIDERIVS